MGLRPRFGCGYNSNTGTARPRSARTHSLNEQAFAYAQSSRNIVMQTLLLSMSLFAAGIPVALASPASPYAGQEAREIKALAPEEVDDYLTGKGMGLAKAAELNGYPGPAHVLALSQGLALTPDQILRTESLFRRMESKATTLGRSLIEQERALDTQFASKAITPASLHALLAKIAEAQGQLREVHLQTHLEQMAILSPVQVARYQELRGYAQKQGGHSHVH